LEAKILAEEGSIYLSHIKIMNINPFAAPLLRCEMKQKQSDCDRRIKFDLEVQKSLRKLGNGSQHCLRDSAESSPWLK
jgi:hypothetical protein